ncbi:MAG TPA: hypothetical protein V6D19_15140 [Stenomitos sp.]
MTLNEIPPKKRKAILVISPHELTRLEFTTGGNDLLLSEQIYLLDSSGEVTSSLEKKLDDSGLLEPGNLLIQNPYDTSDYVILDKASSTFALTKYLHFTTLCGLLGAREVIVEQIEVKTLTGRQVFKGSLNNPFTEGKMEGVNTTFEEIRNNIKLQSKFGGGEPNIEEADDHLRQYQLSNDISMKSLIDQRKGTNPIKSRELILSLSEESKKNLKAITDIKVPVYANLQAQLEQIKKEVYEFTLSVKVEF